jgi:hypothetical protein
VVPLFLSLRDRVVWIREAENAKDAVRRVLRATLVTLSHLVALYLYQNAILSGHVSLRAHSPNVRSRFSLADSRPGRAGDSSRPKPASLASGSRSSNSSSESTEIFSGASSSAKS